MAVQQDPVIIVNGVFLIGTVILLIQLFRVANQFNWAFGDAEKQNPARIKFLKILVLLIALGFIGAITNIILFANI